MAATFAELKARFEAGADNAETVVALFIEAMLLVETDRDAGEQALALMCSKDMLSAAPGTATGFKLRDGELVKRLLAAPNIARSYAGATYTNDYAWDGKPAVRIAREYSPSAQGVHYPQQDQAKLFIACGGADTPRPMLLKMNNLRQWKVVNWSSLTVGVRKGASAAGDF